MSYFTNVFHALDYNNKGYILIKDFKNEMEKYLNKDVDDTTSGEALQTFLDLVKIRESGELYFEDFISGINEVENLMINTQEMLVADEDLKCQGSGSCPFINDGDNYSTGDNGFDNEWRACQTFNRTDNPSIGKINRKLIKRFQQPDIIPSKNVLGYNLSQNDIPSAENTKSNYIKRDFELPLDDLTSILNGRRQSDVVICARQKSNQHRKEDDAHSLNCWTPCSGSAADLFYYDSMTDIQKSLQKLEQSVDNLHNISKEAKHSKRKHTDDTYFLSKQIQKLDEKNRELEKQFENDLYRERESARKNLGKLEKMKVEEIEYLKWSLKTKEEEFESQRKESQIILTDNEKLRYDKARSEDKLGDLLLQMTYIEGEMKRLKDFHNRELEVLMSERNTVLMKAAKFEGRNIPADDISRLKSENMTLKSKLEKCEGELLALSVLQGQNILLSTNSDYSWKAEIDGYTKDEVIDLLVKEKYGNFQLREYVSRILTRILEKDPSLLEIS